MTITLDDVTPAVTRMIEVPLGIRLDRLHTTFQEALGWTDSHLWELTFGRTGFGIPDPSYGFGGPLDARKNSRRGVGGNARQDLPVPLRLWRRMGAQRQDPRHRSS
ncbi:IS1096 element passenger TnpR family protein [Novosphingobium lindaniclasticum]